MNYIPYGRQSIDEDDINAVISVLKSDYLTQGPETDRFEERVRNYCGAKFSRAVNSATSALHVSCVALGLGEGDIVWTTPISFVASANCALYCGATVDFVDIDPATGNMSLSALEEKLQVARKAGVLPKVLVVVHFAGQPCQMREIQSLASVFGFHVIEDASHALGAHYEGGNVGNCQYSDITIFSFHPVKMVTSAEGGMILTNDAVLYKSVCLSANHGIERSVEGFTEESEGEWSYQQLSLGFNYRMSDVHAVLGNSQLTKLDGWVHRRTELAERYQQLIAQRDLPLTPLIQRPGCQSSFHLFVVLLDEPTLRPDVFAGMRKRNIGVQVHYIPIYKQPYYLKLGFPKDYLQGAEYYYSRALTLPLFPELSTEEQDHVINALAELTYSKAERS